MDLLFHIFLVYKMIEGIIYWKSKVTGKTDHGNVIKYPIALGFYIISTTYNYFIPISSQVRKIYNQE